jgi:DNA repair protein RadD
MTFTLRDYQTEMSEIIVERLLADECQPFLVQAATGAGKSLVIADVAHKLNAPVLVLQPSLELLLQNHAKMLSYGIDASIYSASAGQKVIGENVVMATIGSIYQKPELFAHFQYVVVDEADVVNPKAMTGMYQQFFEAIKCHNIVGLTATPYRIETKYAYKNNDLYAAAALQLVTRIGTFWSGGIAYKIETQELIDKGYLSPIIYRADSNALHGLVVNSTGADYTTDSLEEWGAKKVERMLDYCVYVDKYAKRNLVFCTSVLQTKQLGILLAAKGIESATVTAETPVKVREQVVADFRAGKIKHLLNVGVFLAGFDVPELDCIIFARPTLSPRVWYQAVGRGVRLDPASPDKKLRVFDLAGALHKIGRVETLRLGTEASTGRDTLSSEIGRIDDRPLWKFRIQRKPKRSHR